MTDARVYEVIIVLSHGDNGRPLAPDEGRAVIDAFASVRREATKWRLMTQQAGRLLLIDPQLVAEIEEFLASDDPHGQLDGTRRRLDR